jgi:hypothetical protein
VFVVCFGILFWHFHVRLIVEPNFAKMTSNSPVELGTDSTGPKYITPKPTRPSSTITVDDVLNFI